MDFEIPEGLEALRARVRSFLEERVLPHEARWLRLEEEIFPACVEDGEEIRALQGEARALGAWAGHLPREAGGMGLSVTEYGLLNEVIGRAYFGPRIFGSNAPDSGNAELLWLYGTPDQKERFFWPLQRAEARSFFAMTEPEVSGSDPTALMTTAMRDGSDWVIEGHKWFASNANGSTFGIVMAATEAGAPPHERYTQIIVPTAAQGLRLVRPLSVMGHRTGPGHWELRFEGCRVPRENTLGPPGQGFALAQARLGPGRIHHCMRFVGQAQRALELMSSYAKQRSAFGGPLAEKQTVQNWIAESAAEIEAARLLTLKAAWRIDRAGTRGARADISLVKFFAAKVLQDVLDRAVQVHGGLGVTEDAPLSFMWRQARAARIYDGPDEVHKRVLAAEILKGAR